MNEETYLNERLEDQINWYDKKSGINKRKYHRCQFTLILLAAFVTLSGVFRTEDFPFMAYLIPSLGAGIAILTGVLGLYKYQEHWLEYRTTAESLKHEKHLYLMKTGPYNTTNALHILVERVEALISQENSKWLQNLSNPVNEDNSSSSNQ